MTQAVFSGKMGVSVPMQKSYESGKATPGIVYLSKLQSITGISAAILSENDVPVPELSREIMRIRTAEKVEEGELFHMVSDTVSRYGQNGSSDANVKPVEFDGFMEVSYLPVHAQAGYLTGVTHHHHPETDELPTLLVPKEFEKGRYIVIEVNGDSMDDGTKRAICDRDKLLVKELDRSFWGGAKLDIKNYLFAIVHTEGIVVKQISNYDYDKGEITLHSWNPMYEDFKVLMKDVYQLFYIKKIVERKPMF